MEILPAVLLIFRKTVSKEIVFLVPFIILTFFAAFYEIIVTDYFGVNQTLWFKVYTLLEFLCINYFFQRLIPRAKNILYAFLIIFSILFISLQAHWIIGGVAETDSWLSIVETIMVYLMALFWFKDIFANMDIPSLWHSPAFYFIAGFILYFSGTFFLFIMVDLVFTLQEGIDHWVINVILTLILCLIISIGIWIGQQKSPQYSG